MGVRLPLSVAPETWYGELDETLMVFFRDSSDRIKGEDTLKVIVEPTGFAVPAWECEKNTKLVRGFLSAIRSQGGEPRFVYKTGTADLNVVAPAWKCPAAVYGPGDSSLDHTPNEHISLEEYSKSVEVLVNVLNRLTE